MLPCLNNSFCILYIFHCPSKLLWRWMLCLSLCQGRENMIGSWEFCIIGSSWSCNPSLAEETWCVRWEYWYNVFFFLSRRFKREGQTQRYSIPKHPTPKKQIYGGRGAEGIIRKKWCVVVWRWANVSVGSKHSPDMGTLRCWNVLDMLCKEKEVKGQKRLLSKLLDGWCLYSWKNVKYGWIKSPPLQQKSKLQHIIQTSPVSSHVVVTIEVLGFAKFHAWCFVPWLVSGFLSLEVPQATAAKAAPQVGSIASIGIKHNEPRFLQ